jgi:hypothetical protein
MAKTARQIITASLRKLGVIASGETPSADELQDGLSALQGLLDSWSTNDLLSYTDTEETFTLTAGKQDYTIGYGGDFNTARPLDILGAAVLGTSGIELHLNQLKPDQWRGIPLKSIQSELPTDCFFETSWPLATLQVYPVPSGGKQIVIYSRKPFASVANVNTSIDLPHGYEDAVVYNLAIEIADEYGAQVSPLLMKRAEDALASIKARNLASNIPFAATEGMFQGSSGRGSYNILKGG